MVFRDLEVASSASSGSPCGIRVCASPGTGRSAHKRIPPMPVETCVPTACGDAVPESSRPGFLEVAPLNKMITAESVTHMKPVRSFQVFSNGL